MTAGVFPNAVASASITTARLDLYVSNINGNDFFPGTIALPLKTLTAARSYLRSVARIIAHDVVIHVGKYDNTGIGKYTWANINGFKLVDSASIYVYGDGAGQPGEDGFTSVLASTAAGAGSGASVIKGAFGVDAYRGFTVEVLTGAATGDRRSVRNNTATDLIPTMPFTAAVALNDTFRIVRPQVLFTFVPDIVGDNGTLCAGIGTPHGPYDDVPIEAPESMLYVVNFAMTTSGVRPDIIDSAVCFVGVETPTGGGLITATGEIAMGETSPSRMYALALVAGATAWHGWGMTRLAASSFFLNGAAYWHGTLVGFTTFLQGTCTFDLRSGHLRSTSATQALGVTAGVGNSRPLLRIGGAIAASTTGVVIENTSTGAGLQVEGPGALCEVPLLDAAATVTITSAAGPAISVFDFGQMYTAHLTGVHMTITGGTFGVSAKSGGKVGLSGNVLTGITGGTAGLTIDDLTGITATDLTVTSRSAIAGASGTVIMRT